LVVILDLDLHREAVRRLDDLLETHGLAHFLEPGGAPFHLDEARIQAVIAFASQRIGRDPVPSARMACYRAIRRRLIRELAEALVSAGY